MMREGELLAGQHVVEHTVAEVYNQEFDTVPMLRRLEKAKKFPIVGSIAKNVQTMMLNGMEKAVQVQMDIDTKTGLLNAHGLNERATEAAARLARETAVDVGESWIVLFGDINWFKAFNDSLGQGNGDEYIKGVASVLKNCVRSNAGDLVARHGGEEFVIVMRMKPGSDVGQLLDVNGMQSGGVLMRIRAGMKDLRQRWIKEQPSAFSKEIEFQGQKTNLISMGTGTLALGIEHLTRNEIVGRYLDWNKASELGQTDKDFVNFALIDAAQTTMKEEAKPLARFNQTSAVYAFVKKDRTSELK